MTENLKGQVPAIAARLGFPDVPADWAGCGPVWPFLERMREEGAVVVVKLDGERTEPEDNGPYTVLASGKPLGGDFIRIDASTLEEGLAHVIVEYARKCWPE